MPKVNPKHEQYIFAEVNGLYVRVDSREAKPQTFAEFLKEHDIVFDDTTQFVRLIRWYDKYKCYVEIRVRGMYIKVGIYAIDY